MLLLSALSGKEGSVLKRAFVPGGPREGRTTDNLPLVEKEMIGEIKQLRVGKKCFNLEWALPKEGAGRGGEEGSFRSRGALARK